MASQAAGRERFCAHAVFATIEREWHEMHRMAEGGHAKSSEGTPRHQ